MIATIQIRDDKIRAGIIAAIGIYEEEGKTVFVKLGEAGSQELSYTCKTQKSAKKLLARVDSQWSKYLAAH